MLAALLLITCAGCSPFRKSARRTYETLPNKPQQKAESAKKLNAQGLEKLQLREFDAAEKLFGEALAIDVNYGPAHNNLGQVYLKRHQLYLAAWEFEFAANLMPDKNQAFLNLGLVYETAGEMEKARGFYEAAFELDQTDADAIGNLARINVKLDAEPARVHWLLQQVVLHDDRPVWLKWAKDLLATRYRLDTQSSVVPVEPTQSEPRSGYALPPMLEELPVPAPVPKPDAKPETFIMPEAERLKLSQAAILQLPSDIPQLPASLVIPASYESSAPRTQP
ncbi:MAG: hypothetical protein R3C53_19385 [Pirellulaceae bacterium]